MATVDLSQLPVPDVVEELDYETILAERKAILISLYPEDQQEAIARTLALESEPIVKLLQENAYREIIWRQRVNEAAQAVTLAYSAGNDLDVVAGNNNTERLTITPADDTTIPPTPAVMESDTDLRLRTQQAFEGLSVAGPVGAYEYHGRSADGRVADVSAASPSPACVTITVLSREGDGTASPDLLAIVDKALNAEDVRPVADRVPTPDPAQTKLINQKRIAPLNLLTVDPANTSQIIAEQIIPENEGGFWIREIGLYDDDGILIAVANCPETYKPQLQEGSGRTQTIRMILIVSSTSAITLKIDPAVVLATRQYVDDKIIEVKGYADDLMKKHVEAANPHKQYPLIANALKEMVDAGLAGDVLKNLGLGEAAKRNVGTGANQIPDMGSFTLSVSGTGYQKLPSGFILQWGSIGAPGIAQDVVTHFPIAFPNRCLRVLVSQDYTPDSGAVGYIACAGFSPDPVKFISRASTPGLGASFLALGC